MTEQVTTATLEGVLFLRRWNDGTGTGHATFWCPGCEQGHTIFYGSDETWTWDGDTEHPTFEPSVLVFPHQKLNAAGKQAVEDGIPITDEHRYMTPRCHTFVRAGRIQYLDDCEHALAGQTIDMMPLPDRWNDLVD